MANTPQSKKRVIQNKKRQQRNVGMRSMYRTHIKKMLTAIGLGDKAVAAETFKTTTSVIDKMVTKKIIHKNKAARHKSRLVAKIKKMA